MYYISCLLRHARNQEHRASISCGVNVLLAHNDEDGSPIIFETTPTYTNLFGTIQRSYDSRGGGWNSDFMDLRAGSTLRADGGFLVMYANDALAEAGVWRTLKRMLNNSRPD